MKLGLNLSFAAKRWLEPVQLADMIKNDFGIDHVQFTLDFINPWWPQAQRDVMVYQFKDAFDDAGIQIDACVGGSATNTYPQLLAPAKVQRDISFMFFKRAIDMTLELGGTVMGMSVGGMTYDDAKDPEKREELYQDMLDYLRRLAEYGGIKGIKEIHIEATPLVTEFSNSPEAAAKLMKDLEGTDIPIKLMIDWGHALSKEAADIDQWYEKCDPYIGSIQLRQTKIVAEEILDATKKAGLDDIPQYLEVITAFEDDNDVVYEAMKKTMDYLHAGLGV